MNDEQYFLANAYVDGELTADERALADADPDVMSEVELLLILQTRLRKVDPPMASAREAAMTAAMAAFPAAVPRPAPAINAAVRNTAVVPLRRRPAYARYLGLAAAVVAVGLLGTVVVSGLRSGDDDSAASEPAFDAPTEAVADEPASEPASEPAAPTADRLTEVETDMAEGDGQLDMDDSAAAAPADDMAGSDADAELRANEPASESADQAAEEPAEEPAANDGDFEQPLIDPTQPLTGATDLGAYGTYLVELQAAGELPPTPNTRCPQPGLLGQTQYVFDDVIVDVYIVVDDQNRTVSAIDTDTCEVLAVGPLF